MLAPCSCPPVTTGLASMSLGVLTSRHDRVLYLQWWLLALVIDLGQAPPAHPRGSSASLLHP